MFASNCYIVGAAGEAIVIDPGVGAEKIVEIASTENLTVKYIVLTHAHIDHMVSIDKLKDITGAVTVAHRLDAQYMTDAWYNGSKLFGRSDKFQPVDREAEDGDRLAVGGIEFVFLHTPGHTPGGMCVYVEGQTAGSVFTGDTLFYRSVGNTSLGNGSEEDLMRSIREKLLTLTPQTVVYPGHGINSTIGYEMENNPFL